MKLTKANSTPGERKIGEILKKNKINFEFKKQIDKYVVDFLIGRMALDLDYTDQNNPEKELYLMLNGYVPLHTASYVIEMEKSLLYWIEANNSEDVINDTISLAKKRKIYNKEWIRENKELNLNQ